MNKSRSVGRKGKNTFEPEIPRVREIGKSGETEVLKQFRILEVRRKGENSRSNQVDSLDATLDLG